MGKGGRYLQSAGKKSGGKKGKKILLAVLLVLLLLIAAAVIGGVVYYNSMLNLITRPTATENSLSDEELEEILGYSVEREETEAAVETTAETTAEAEQEDKILNIMLVGQNYRKGEEHKLSDTMILCSINKETKTVTLTSFLRDLYVQLPNFNGYICGKNRINVAYNLGWRWAGELGGMEMLDLLILNNFGVEVDYNVEFGFESFEKIIDLIGGVDMELTADEARALSSDPELGSYSAGLNHLNGAAALGYVRTRHANAGDNDFNRTERQRKLITNVLNQCKSLSISELNALLQEALPLIITDMTNEEITACALELLPMLVDLKIVSNQCPADGTYSYAMINIAGVDSSVIVCDEEQNRALLMEIAEGTVAETE